MTAAFYSLARICTSTSELHPRYAPHPVVCEATTVRPFGSETLPGNWLCFRGLHDCTLVEVYDGFGFYNVDLSRRKGDAVNVFLS